jgi:hypothetical protein
VAKTDYNSQDYRLGDAESDNKGKSDTKKYRKRVEHAVKWRKDAGYDAKWAKFLKLYASQYEYDELSGYEDIVAPNLVFSTVNIVVPSIVVNYPKITVTARKAEDEGAAATVEAMCNYNWQRYNVHEELKLAIRDFVMFGIGITKVTWVLREEEVELDRDEYSETVAQALMEVQQGRLQADTEGLGVTFPTDDEVVRSAPTTKIKVTADHPSVERVSIFDIYMDPDATRPKNARWIAQRMYVPLEVAKANEDWSKSARKKLVATAMSEAKKDQETKFDGEERGGEAEFVVVWEYYDLINKQMCVFAEGCDEHLIAPDDTPLPFPHPYVFALNYIIPEKLYPLGDVESIVPLQMELALTRTQMINDRKRFRRMYMYKPDEIGPDGLAALLSGDDNAMIPVDYDGPLADVIAPITTTSYPPEAYNQTAMIMDDTNLTTGVNEYQRGTVSEVRRTATEAGMINDMANARSADKLALVEQAISELARRTVQLAQEFLTTEQVARVVGEQGAMEWVNYSREDIEGEFDFQVEAGSTRPQNESQKRQSAMQMMDAMAPFIQMGVVNPQAIAENVLRDGFGIKNPEQYLQAPPPPMPAPGQEQPGMPPEMGGMPPGMM